MITPDAIEEKEFKRSLGGYDRDEVDEFLDCIIVDMRNLISENNLLKTENETLKAENNQYKESEKSVMKTLESAKKLMKDISVSAEKRADTMIQSAKLDAETIVHDAKTSVSRYTDEANKLKERVYYFKSRYKQLLQEELDYMDDRGGDLLADLEKEFELFNSGGEDLYDDQFGTYSEEEAAAEIFSAIERDIEKEPHKGDNQIFPEAFYDDRDTKPNGINVTPSKQFEFDMISDTEDKTPNTEGDDSENEDKDKKISLSDHVSGRFGIARDTMELDPEKAEEDNPKPDGKKKETESK
jgi:cell division initiation protein